MFRRRIAPAPTGRYLTPLSASGISAGNDQRVEDHRRQDRARGRRQPHHIERAEHGIGAREGRGNDGEVFRDVVGDRERRQRAARHQELLADLDDLDQLGRIRVQVDHVAGFLRRLRAAVHHDGHVGLRQRGRIVGAVAGHRDELALCLDVANQLELCFGRHFREEVINTGLRGDRGRRELVVAGDHDRLDAHPAQFREAFLDMGLDDVLELDHAENMPAFGDHERRRAAPRHVVDARLDLRVERASLHNDPGADGVDRALAQLAAMMGDAAHPRLRRERNDRELAGFERWGCDSEGALDQRDDALSLGSLVTKRRQQRGFGELLRRDAGNRRGAPRPGGCRA